MDSERSTDVNSALLHLKRLASFAYRRIATLLDKTPGVDYTCWVHSMIIVPPLGRIKVLIDLHSGHPGISRMKALSRSLVWWPGLDSDFEKLVKTCTPCQQSQPLPAAVPLHPWQWPHLIVLDTNCKLFCLVFVFIFLREEECSVCVSCYMYVYSCIKFVSVPSTLVCYVMSSFISCMYVFSCVLLFLGHSSLTCML